MDKVDIDFLKKFYGVQTDDELIVAMNGHIEKLQALYQHIVGRLSPSEPAVRQVRA